MTLVFLDIETTGLDPSRHEVWEIAYAVDDGPVRSSFVAHGAAGADPVALRLNGYLQRFRGEPLLGLTFESELREVLKGATVVGANPAFDTGFLRERWGDTPWHHRLWDVEAYAAGVLGLDKLLGNAGVADTLRERGFTIPQPDHTAAADVEATRASFYALKSLSKGGVQ